MADVPARQRRGVNENRLLLGLLADHHNGDPYAADRIIRIVYRDVTGMATRYFFAGADRDDVIQEGLIGVYRGIRTFKPAELKGGAKQFLLFCAERKIIAGVKAKNRLKHSPLTESVTLEPRHAGGTDREDATLHDVLPGGRDPAAVVIERERIRRLVLVVQNDLTDAEREGLRKAVNGEPYSVEATGSKVADNALQRARRKLREAA
jgi:RNA polymerase sporulation-specific sigma factor